MKKSILFPMAAIAASLVFLTRHSAEARPDVISSASLTVSIINITATTATASYSKDKYNYGTRTLCYDPAPAAAKNNCTTKNAVGNAGTFSITGLTAGIQYNYLITASDNKHKNYSTGGAFTTLKPTATGIKPMGRSTPAVVARKIEFDLTGRSVREAKANSVNVSRNPE